MPDYPIFSVMGIEIEYMLVDQNTLNVQARSDVLLKALAQGEQVDEVTLGDVALSNELVMHVIELKNNGPKPPSADIAHQFYKTILQLSPLLNGLHLQLLPGGAHPWMNPLRETVQWPYGQRDIYQKYDSIFNCQGHGWSNLQSMHVNLPFANDEEFCHLHTLIRQFLPLLPALAASTPILESKYTGYLDARLDFYGRNQNKIPSISGGVIPDFVRSQKAYEEDVLAKIYRDLSPFDPEGILQHEWVNSRGAIPKFQYGAIETRIIDSQECVAADIAIALAMHAILKSWYETSHIHIDQVCSTQTLKRIYDETIKHGLSVMIEDKALLALWQLPQRALNVRDAWSLLIERVSSSLDQRSQLCLEHILHHGNLSERILKACRNQYDRATLTSVYRQLGQCLLHNQSFEPL